MASRTVITLVTLQCLDQEVLVAVEQNPTNINGWVIKLHSTGTKHLQLAILKIRWRLGRLDVMTKCIMGLFWGKLSPILCAGTWVKTRDNSQTSSLPMMQFKYNTVLRNGQKVTGFGFRMMWEMLQISEGVTTSRVRATGAKAVGGNEFEPRPRTEILVPLRFVVFQRAIHPKYPK